MSVDALLASLHPGGKDFERLCKWMLENAPEYRSKIKRVWHWNEWPGRWGVDAGIDLVAEADDGLWAVQAKHYNPAYAIKKADLDSFLSESSRARFSYRLLVATTDHLGPTARRTLAAQEKPVGVVLRSDLEALAVEWPRSVRSLRPARPRPKRPRPHQRAAVKACVEGLNGGDRGQLVMACGTGKTMVGYFLAEALDARRTLVLVPSLSLLKQTLREWLTQRPFDYLAVCSDETVAAEDQDAVIASTTELGVPVTTDPAAIATFLRRRRPGVVFATYQSSPRIAEAQRSRTPAFDLAICDEAHRCAGPEAGMFATVLDPGKITARRRVFMTATPRYFTGRVKKEAKEADWEVASMDDEGRFGPVLHRLSFAEAIERDLLSDYRVVVVGVSDETYREYAERGVFVTHDGETVTDARTLASKLGLLRSLARFDLRRVVTFHSRISGARNFARSVVEVAAWMPPELRPSGEIWGEHVSGEMTSGEREVKLNRLRAVQDGERGILANARCLSEGVDVPALDGVAFIDPRRSQVDVVQAVGRVIRKAEDKAVGTIVLPVFVDETADPEEALDASEFRRVWEVVRALRDHDETLAEELDELRRELGRIRKLGERPGKIVLDLPVSVGDAFARAFDSRLIERTTTSWQHGLGAAQAYHEEHGHLHVPDMYVAPDGFKLGGWIQNRRQNRRKGWLASERVAALDALGMVWDQREYVWQRGLRAAKEHRHEFGHLRVPVDYVSGDGFRLGGWLHKSRQKKRAGRLSLERVTELEALGVVWSPQDENWERGIEAAEAYREAHGHQRVPSDYVAPDGFRLGQWIHHHRTVRRRGALGAKRVAELDALDMVWEPWDEDWQRGIDAARAFWESHRHLRVPQRYRAPDGFPLGTWCSNRRAEESRGKLPPERIAALDALGMVWDPFDEDWQRGIAAARAYLTDHGHLLVPAKYESPDGYPLGKWLDHRRRFKKNGQLSADRIAELDALGIVWNPREANWQRGIAAAREYREAHGDLRASGGYVTPDGFRLGYWLGLRRAQRTLGTLSPDKIEALDDLGMVWSKQRAETTQRT